MTKPPVPAEEESCDLLAGHLEKVLIDSRSLRKRLIEMGRQITEDYRGRELAIVTILQGGMVFMADLIREVHLPLTIGSVSVASYHGGTTSSGTVTFHQSKMPDIRGKHVLVLDDILDSGRTLAAILRRFEEECQPASMKVCVLLEKQVERTETVDAHYCGFSIGDEFVVGYGLDYDGQYRNLPMIGVLSEEFINQ
jgi:hypoxanthine phosphoribosyltransferase